MSPEHSLFVVRHMVSNSAWMVAALLLSCSAASLAASGLASARAGKDVSCGRPADVPGGRHDYRQRQFDPELGRLADLQVQYHLQPAQEALRTRYWPNVSGNIDFMLRNWPNFEPALRLLIAYEKATDEPAVEDWAGCYFQWAREFAPDDPAVWSSSGHHYWRQGDLERARGMWTEALKLDPSSAEVNYNLGLVSFELKDYEGARAFARSAYAAGYPLPGLRNSLKSIGRW